MINAAWRSPSELGCSRRTRPPHRLCIMRRRAQADQPFAAHRLRFGQTKGVVAVALQRWTSLQPQGPEVVARPPSMMQLGCSSYLHLLTYATFITCPPYLRRLAPCGPESSERGSTAGWDSLHPGGRGTCWRRPSGPKRFRSWLRLL